jgi:hypothetical protein
MLRFFEFLSWSLEDTSFLFFPGNKKITGNLPVIQSKGKKTHPYSIRGWSQGSRNQISLTFAKQRKENYTKKV